MSLILFADDDEFLTGVCAEAFERAGYQFISAKDGHEACDKLVQKKPDLLLLDLKLPGIDGIGVLKFLRSRPDLEKLPVFIISSSSYFSAIVQTAWAEGATQFIRKGEFSPAGIVDEVRKTLPPDGTAPVLETEKAKPTNKPAAPKPKKAKKSGPKSILIVDDDRTIHGVLTYFLGQAKYEIESAFNGEQALAMARTSPPDLLVLDVTMPVKGGFETLEEWVSDEELKNIPVIMLTASKDTDIETKALSGGATKYLTKPFTPDALVDLAMEILG